MSKFKVGDIVEPEKGFSFAYEYESAVVLKTNLWYRRGWSKVCTNVGAVFLNKFWVPDAALKRVYSDPEEAMLAKLERNQ